MATRRYYSAIAQDTTLSSSVTSTAPTITVSGVVGYPSSTPFVLAIDFNASTEELVLVTGVSGTTLNVTRGYNGSTNVAHNTGATVRHVIVAQDLTDFQDHATASSGVHGTTGQVASLDDVNNVAFLTMGA
jgi:hypothetical protein